MAIANVPGSTGLISNKALLKGRHAPFTRREEGAFTLIEMIGLLAVIALLSALLMPKIFESISNARLSHTAINVQTVKTAVMEHFAKYGSLATRNGAPLVFTGEYLNFDQVLLAEGLIDKLFASKLAASAYIRIANVSGFTSATSIERDNAAYDLDGDGNNNIVGASYLVDAILIGMTTEEAAALNDLIDGPALGANPGGNDTRGRVRYHKVSNAGGNANGGGNGNANGATNGNATGGTTGNSSGGSNGNATGGSTGNATGGSTGNATGGSTGNATGGSTGNATGGSTGNATGGSTGNATGGSTGNATGGSTGNTTGGSTDNGTGGSTGNANGGSNGNSGNNVLRVQIYITHH